MSKYLNKIKNLSEEKLIIICYIATILSIYFYNSHFYLAVYLGIIILVANHILKCGYSKLKIIASILAIYLMLNASLPIILFSVLVFVLRIMVATTQINDGTFRFIFYQINPQKRDVEMVRLLLTPTGRGKVGIFEIKQELFKILHSFGGVKLGHGGFKTWVLLWKDTGLKGDDIWKKYIRAYNQETAPVRLGFIADVDRIRQFIEVPKINEPKIRNQLQSLYPGMEIESEDLKLVDNYKYQKEGIVYGDWRSRLKTFKDEQVDPLDSMLTELDSVKHKVEIVYELLPLGDYCNAVVEEKLESIPIENPSRGAKDNTTEATTQDKANSCLFQLKITLKSDVNNFNGIIDAYAPVNEISKSHISFEDQYSSHSLNQSVVSESDLWALWHIVTNSSKIKLSRHVPLPYPNELLEVKSFPTVFGKSNSANFTDRLVGIPTDEDKFKHLNLFGKTGGGKTTLLSSLVKQDAERGLPIFFLDFKGETAPKLLDILPENRVKDIVYISPKENIIPMSIFDNSRNEIMSFLNILAGIGRQNIENAFGDTVERLSNTLSILAKDTKQCSVREIQNQIINIINHKGDVKSLKMSDNVLVKTFAVSVDATSRQRLVDMLSSTINKLSKLLIDETCINSLDNPNAKLNFSDCIRENKIVIINLPDSLGERTKVSLSIFYVMKIKEAIIAQTGEVKQTGFYFDEAQIAMNMLPSEFESSFSQLRYNKCSLVTANQYSEQNAEEVRKSMRNNASNLILLGLLDSETREAEANQLGLDEEYELINLLQIPRGVGYARVIANGNILPPTTFKFVPETPYGRDIEKIKQQTVREYGVPNYTYVAEGINRSMTSHLDKTEEVEEVKKILTKRPDRRNVTKIKKI